MTIICNKNITNISIKSLTNLTDLDCSNNEWICDKGFW